MVDFICMGLLDLWGARTEYYEISLETAAIFFPATFYLKPGIGKV